MNPSPGDARLSNDCAIPQIDEPGSAILPMPGRAGCLVRHTSTTRVEGHNGRQGARMGDKGGKKDKEKSKQQHVKQQKEAAQRKQDKALPRNA
jgi:hypothetical protein